MPSESALLTARTVIKIAREDPDAAEQLWELVAPQMRELAEKAAGIRAELSERARRSAWRVRYGVAYPETDADFKRWVGRLGIPPHYFVSQDWDEATLLPFIEGYLLRKQDLSAPAAIEDQSNLHKQTVEQRMLLALQDDPRRESWSKYKFAELLNCSPSAVQKTNVWKTMVMGRRKN